LQKKWWQRERRYLPIVLALAFVPLLLFVAYLTLSYLAFGFRG